MKKIFLKTSLIGGLYLAVAGYSVTVSAHDVAGALTNGLLTQNGSGATDLYAINCFQDPNAASPNAADHLFFQIRDDSSAGGQVSATAILSDNKAVSVTDLTPADGIASTARTLKVTPAATSATFIIAVHHTIAAADNYLLTAHCQDTNNAHTGTDDPVPLQNQ